MSNALHRYASPLRYPGGKAQVTNFLKFVMLENGLVGREYVEPYAGGASVALSLLYEEYVSAVHINDLNLGVYAFWWSVLNQTDEFCALVDQTPLTIREWRRQREIASYGGSNTLERGFATFYLNRTNRSGIISGGVIGGLGQSGPWKIDARFPRDELVRRIRKVARFRSRINVTRRDTLELLMSASSAEAGRRFYFLDPPYYARGERLYDNFYNHDDHVRIRNSVVAVRDPWVVSYDAAPEIMHMYREWPSLRYSLSYSANARARGSEVMFSAPWLVMPEESPTDVTAKRVHDARVGTLMLPFG